MASLREKGLPTTESVSTLVSRELASNLANFEMQIPHFVRTRGREGGRESGEGKEGLRDGRQEGRRDDKKRERGEGEKEREKSQVCIQADR